MKKAILPKLLIQFYLTVICFFFVPTSDLFASKLDRGFKMLTEKKYEKAKQVFYDILEEKPNDVPARFGIGYYFFSADNSNMNLDSAYIYWSYCFDNFNTISKEEITLVEQYYPFSKEIISKLLYSLCATSYSNLISAPSVSKINSYLLRYRVDAALFDKVGIVLEDSLYSEAEKSESIEKLKNYLTTGHHTESRLHSIHKKLENIDLNLAKELKSNAKYIEFLNNYPDSQQKNIIEVLLRNGVVNQIAKMNSVDEIDRFIDDFPISHMKEDLFEIKDSLSFAQVKIINTRERYKAYIEENPKSKHIVDALYLIDLISVHDALGRSPQEIYSFIKENRDNLCLNLLWEKLYSSTVGINKMALDEFETQYSPVPASLFTQNTIDIKFKKVFTTRGKYVNISQPENGYFKMPYIIGSAYANSKIIRSINKKIDEAYNYTEQDFKEATSLFRGEYETHLPIIDTTFIYKNACIMSIVISSISVGFGNQIEYNFESFNVNMCKNDSITLNNSFEIDDLVKNTRHEYWNRLKGKPAEQSKNIIEMGVYAVKSEDDEVLENNCPITSKNYKCFFISADSIYFFNNISPEINSDYDIDLNNDVAFGINELLPYMKRNGNLLHYIKSNQLNSKYDLPSSLLKNTLHKDSLKNILDEGWQKYIQIKNIMTSRLNNSCSKSDFENNTDYLIRVSKLEQLLSTLEETYLLPAFQNLKSREKLLFEDNSINLFLDSKKYDANKELWEIQYRDNLYSRSVKTIEVSISSKLASHIFNEFNKSVSVRGIYSQPFHSQPILKAIQLLEKNQIIYTIETNFSTLDTIDVKYRRDFNRVSKTYDYCAFLNTLDADGSFIEEEEPKDNSVSIISYAQGLRKPVNLYFQSDIINDFTFDNTCENIFITTINKNIYQYNLHLKKPRNIGYNVSRVLPSIEYLHLRSHKSLPLVAIISLTADQALSQIDLLDIEQQKIIKTIPISQSLFKGKSVTEIEWKYDGSLKMKVFFQENRIPYTVNFVNETLD